MASPWYHCLTGVLRLAVVLLVFGALTNAALIPSKQIPVISHPNKKVTWGDSNNDNAKSSVCSDTQTKVLVQSMSEAAKLAKAGSDGLEIILDMLDAQTKYKALARKDQNRVRETYFTLFGAITSRKQFDTFKTRALFIKVILDRIAPLTQSTWPAAITFFCDSSYYQDKDQNGKTWDQVDPPKKAPPKSTREWKYDVDKKIWSEVLKQSDCKASGSTVAAYTVPFNDLKTDRITFCPEWFNIIQSPEAGPSITTLDPAKDIQLGTKLKDFTRKGGRIFLHEHLHTWTFNQIADNSKKLNDVDNPNSYGPDNAQRLASAANTQDKANRNIENVVYWCIAMYYNTWDWSTLSAATPTDATPAPATSPKAAVKSAPKAESEPKSKLGARRPASKAGVEPGLRSESKQEWGLGAVYW